MLGKASSAARVMNRVRPYKMVRESRAPVLSVICGSCFTAIHLTHHEVRSGTPVTCQGCQKPFQMTSGSFGMTNETAIAMAEFANPYSEFPPT